jgi:hypothetical protein
MDHTVVVILTLVLTQLRKRIKYRVVGFPLTFYRRDKRGEEIGEVFQEV